MIKISKNRNQNHNHNKLDSKTVQSLVVPFLTNLLQR